MTMNTNLPVTEADKCLDMGVGKFYQGLFLLREAGEYQREYNAMSVLIDMLTKDREHLQDKYRDKINA